MLTQLTGRVSNPGVGVFSYGRSLFLGSEKSKHKPKSRTWTIVTPGLTTVSEVLALLGHSRQHIYV